MEHPVGVEIEQTVEKLEQDRPYHGRWDGVSLRLRVMMDDLK